MAWRARFDPRLHLAAAIGWAVFAVVTLAALTAAGLAAGQAEERARADAEGLLAEFATQLRDAVSLSLETRRWLLQATAAQISTAAGRDPALLRRTLTAAQAQFPEFAWLGVADSGGRLVAETGDRPAGDDVSTLAWFQQGRQRPFVTDVHQPASSERLLDVAAPLAGGGVLAGHLRWDWVEQQLARMEQALQRKRRVELMLAARDGRILVGPPGWVGRTLAVERDASEGGAYVVGTRAELRLALGMGLGWTAIVRQRAGSALEPARTTGRTVFLTVFAAGLLAAAAAALATQLLTRRLTRLAAEAEAVRRGTRGALPAPAGADEVGRIGAALAQLVDQLQADKRTLQTLNAELDARVAERTRRIERMAEEARHTAVTRERLRLARDLHDTLAHSLMALLTQVRLVRKLQGRVDAPALDAELARAESVATTGLADARAAIAQMRDNGVREVGLGAALSDLARRFGQRSGVPVTLQADALADEATDERAETLFRIVEEALRNVERHACAQSVRLQVQATLAADGARRLCIEVVDDGVGFDPALPRPGHFGLRGIHEQAALIGATLSVQSRSGAGTRIAVALEA